MRGDLFNKMHQPVDHIRLCQLNGIHAEELKAAKVAQDAEIAELKANDAAKNTTHTERVEGCADWWRMAPARSGAFVYTCNP